MGTPANLEPHFVAGTRVRLARDTDSLKAGEEGEFVEGGTVVFDSEPTDDQGMPKRIVALDVDGAPVPIGNLIEAV